MCSSASGELSLDPQHELVVEVPEVVDPVGVDHERVGQPAVLKQPLASRRSSAPAARPPGRRSRRPHPGTRGRPAPCTPRARALSAAGDAQIAVDGQDPLRLPAEPDRLLREPVLALGRAEVLAHLPRRGLAQVDDRQALQMRARSSAASSASPAPTPARRRACSPPPRPPRRRCPPPPITAAPAA